MRERKILDGELSRRASSAIAHGSLTNSKRPQSFVNGVYPHHLKKGHGVYVYDTFDNQYVDFICGLGSNLLGYANEDITQAICSQANKGTTLSLGTEIEVKAAERVKEFFPFIDKLRFLKTGSEACSAAIRIARAYSGKEFVFSEGYHGWSDEFVSLTPPAHGIPPTFDFIKPIAELADWKIGNIAAVIIEPISIDVSPSRFEYLKFLRDFCDETGALLIFDEVITGLRYHEHSVAKSTGVIPDLICLGKSLAGGLPLSVVAGRDAVMESEYFVSSTFAGETLSLAACIKTLDLLQNKHKIDQLWVKGAEFMERFNDIAEGIVQLEGYPTRMALQGDEEPRSLFMQECCRAGILVGPSWFFIHPHIELMDDCLSTFSDIINRIRHDEVTLLGEAPQKPFAQKVREQS